MDYWIWCIALFIQCWGLPIDQEIIQAINGTNGLQDFDTENGEITIQLDMQFNLNEWRRITSKQKGKTRTKRKAWRSTVNRWPNGVVPFTMDNNSFTVADKTIINKALAEWENYTCIRFRKASPLDVNKVVIKDGRGCSSWVGMKQNQLQYLILSKSCRKKHIIVHELGHAIGFVHEQSRPDRDEYVTIKEENVLLGRYYNFLKFSSADVNTYNVKYDYKSIMHYGQKFFSYSDEPTIVTKDPIMQDVIGTAITLSFGDIKTANLMYNCSEICMEKLTCDGQGFQGPDCKCWHPGNPISIKENNQQCKPTSAPLNGRISGSSNKIDSVQTITCNQGYELQMHVKCTKENSVVGWNHLTPFCQRISCGNPGVLQNGHIIGSDFRYGGKIVYSCNSDYDLVGHSDRVCTTRGWSGNAPVCRKRMPNCRNLTKDDALENGGIVCHWEPKTKAQHCQALCNDGYVFVSKPNTYETCSANYTYIWSYKYFGPPNTQIPGEKCIEELFQGFRLESHRFYINGNCSSLTTCQIQEIYQEFKRILDGDNVCHPQTCSTKDMELICGKSS